MQGAELMGLRLKNPVVVSAGPWTRGRDKLRAALDSGAGAVITESIVSEPSPDLCPRFAYNGSGVQNIRMFSGLDMEHWIAELTELKADRGHKQDGLVIANIMAETPSELGYLARKLEKTGIDALELGLSCPLDIGAEIITGNAERIAQFTEAVTKTVSIPVMVKLSQSITDLPKVVHSIERAGAAGISAIDTVRCILSIDIATGTPLLPTYGGYSGAPIRPMGLATVAAIAQSTALPILGIGGIENYDSLLQYIMAGAHVGGIGTAILLKGYRVITETITDLQAWMENQGIRDLRDIRGTGLAKLRAFEEIKVEPKAAYLPVGCEMTHCHACIDSCIDQAIERIDGALRIDAAKCTGCGICVNMCAKKHIALGRR